MGHEMSNVDVRAGVTQLILLVGPAHVLIAFPPVLNLLRTC